MLENNEHSTGLNSLLSEKEWSSFSPKTVENGSVILKAKLSSLAMIIVINSVQLERKVGCLRSVVKKECRVWSGRNIHRVS